MRFLTSGNGMVGVLVVIAGCGSEVNQGADIASGGSGANGEGGSSSSSWPVAGGADASGAGGGLPAGPVGLAVDTNRDGTIDASDAAGKDTWTETRGAVFLANLDDDDNDGIRDADDDVVSAKDDQDDLARIFVGALGGSSSQAAGVLTIGEQAAENVRIFRRTGDDWTLLLGSFGECDKWTPCDVVTTATLSGDELASGVELGIEARSFRMSSDAEAWDGQVRLTLDVAHKGESMGSDAVALRVAPWLLFGNLSPHDQIWSHRFSEEFVDGIDIAAAAAGVSYRTYGAYNDIWTQDFFQTGWTAMPGPGGTVQGMRVANARPWGRGNDDEDLPIAWLTENYLGPERAVIETYNEPNTGDSYDSHGNHDLLPPYGSFPHGRIILGSGVLDETVAFYAAQGAQGEPFRVDTSWLIVGHVDEVFSYVPAQTPLGWKLLVHSPSAMITFLEGLKSAGHGSEKFFVGKGRYNNSDQYVNAAVTVSDILDDEDLMAWAQEAQEQIQPMRDAVVAEVGLEASDVIEIPVFFEQMGDWGNVAWNPGDANLLAFGDTIVMAKPFGPNVDGADLFEADLIGRLAVAPLGSTGNGLQVFFTDDWDAYHLGMGEVHCGSNTEASAPYSKKPLWEVSP